MRFVEEGKAPDIYSHFVTYCYHYVVPGMSLFLGHCSIKSATSPVVEDKKNFVVTKVEK